MNGPLTSLAATLRALHRVGVTSGNHCSVEDTVPLPETPVEQWTRRLDNLFLSGHKDRASWCLNAVVYRWFGQPNWEWKVFAADGTSTTSTSKWKFKYLGKNGRRWCGRASKEAMINPTS